MKILAITLLMGTSGLDFPAIRKGVKVKSRGADRGWWGRGFESGRHAPH